MIRYADNICENLFELYRDCAQINDVQVQMIGEYEFVSNVKSAWPNMIFNPNVENDLAIETLKKIATGINECVLPKTLLLDEKIVTNENLIHLKKFGFMPIAQWTNMILEFPSTYIAEKIAGCEIKIIDSNDAFKLAEWLTIVNEVLFPKEKLDVTFFKNGIERNLFKLFIGFYEGLPAVTTLVYLGKSAGIYMVATSPKYRKKGLAKAVLHHVHTVVANLGYNNIVLHSTTQGLPLYQSLGYQQKGKMILFYSL
jgi:ribosomal protein S18 acetylase RimI-like enzyme